MDGSGQKSKPRLTSTRGAGGSTGERSRALLPDDRRGPRRLPAPPSRRGLRMLGEHLGRPGNCAPADGISRRGELGVPVCPLSLQSGPPVGLGGPPGDPGAGLGRRAPPAEARGGRARAAREAQAGEALSGRNARPAGTSGKASPDILTTECLKIQHVQCSGRDKKKPWTTAPRASPRFFKKIQC